jgi:pimeloyl-ACP methyl ester carboxylesterase
MAEIDYPDVAAEWNGGIHDVGDGESRFRIGLKRISRGDSPKGPVLLVHGASASSRTFEVSDTDRQSRHATGLAGYLADRGWDVWLLDWRSSGVLAPVLMDDKERPLPPDRYNLDASQDDLRAAIRQITSTTGWDRPIPVVGHCIGGALVAQAVATWREPDDPPIGSIVLVTLGLFFNTGFDDWVKGNERFLEEVWWDLNQTYAGGDFFISPWVADEAYRERHPWPRQLEDAYTLWRATPLRHACENEFCARACFMFGMPYRVTGMTGIHEGMYPGGLWNQFGRMPLATYMHCVHHLRRGWMAPWNADDTDTNYLAPEPFGERRVTLITGNENQVWHRDSIDRMYEWLRRELPPSLHGQVRKHVLAGYGHQDLFWSAKAPREVYPLLEQGLAERALATTARHVAVAAV